MVIGGGSGEVVYLAVTVLYIYERRRRGAVYRGSFSSYANVAGTAQRQGVALSHVSLERIMMNGGGDDWQPPRMDRIHGWGEV